MSYMGDEKYKELMYNIINDTEKIKRNENMKRVSETRSLKSLAGNTHSSGTLTIRRVLDVFLTSLNKVRGFCTALFKRIFKAREKKSSL